MKGSRITKSPIDPSEVLASVRDPSAGGTVLFLGTIRNRNEGGIRLCTFRKDGGGEGHAT